MSISYQTVIKQMIKKLENVQEETTNKTKLLQHIHHVHGLCELIIEEEKETTFKDDHISVNEDDLMKMIGNKQTTIPNSEQNDSKSLLDF